jgi:hypothetical protein
MRSLPSPRNGVGAGALGHARGRRLARAGPPGGGHSTDMILMAFCHQFSVRLDDLSVARHHLANFVVTFTHRRHRDAAVERRNFPYGKLDFRVRRWLPMIQGTTCDSHTLSISKHGYKTPRTLLDGQ